MDVFGKIFSATPPDSKYAPAAASGFSARTCSWTSSNQDQNKLGGDSKNEVSPDVCHVCEQLPPELQNEIIMSGKVAKY